MKFFSKKSKMNEVVETDEGILDLDKTDQWEKLDGGLLSKEIEDIQEEEVADSKTIEAGEKVALEIIEEETEKESEITDDEEEIALEIIDGEEEAELEYVSLDEDEDEEGEESPFIVFEKMKSSLGLHTFMDKVVAITTVIVVAVAIVTLVAFGSDAKQKKQVAVMVPVGEELEKVAVLGSDKFFAVADAKKAKEEAARQEEELLKAQEEAEEEEKEEFKVVMKLTSLQKDLKIKFVNEDTGKLIKDIPFEVAITDPSGKEYNYIDEDKDGLIYLNKLESGEYSVAMVKIRELEEYTYSTDKQKIKVKENIDYQKVDVSNEIKDQSEVNMSQEDTAKKEETQAKLEDTVEWVESRKEEYNATEKYTLIEMSNIADPSLSASLTLDTSILKYMMPYGRAAQLSDQENGSEALQVTESNSEITIQSESTSGNESERPQQPVVISVTLQESQVTLSQDNRTKKLTAVVEAQEGAVYELRWNSSEPSLVSVDNQGVLTLVTVPEEDKSCNVVVIAGDKTAICNINIKGSKSSAPVTVTSIEISEKKIQLEVGKSATLTAKVKPDNAPDKGIIWSSSDSAIVTVDKGTITAHSTGTATITAASSAASDVKAECKVTVTAAGAAITLDKNNATLKPGETLTLKATVTPEGQKITWSSSNTDIVTVNDKGKVKAVKEGEATITAQAGNKKASCTIQVKSSYDPKKDTEKTLKDKSGNVVYVKNGDNYVEAKVADYYKTSEFYKKETIASYRYYGWQNIDGKTYYFNKNAEKVTGEQVIQGARYTFSSDGSLKVGSGVLGIDVSTWNGNINWQQVKNSGVSYAIIRTGFRGSTQGALVEDNKFRQNIKGALDAGIKVGVYFFTQAVNEVEAVEEASMVLSQIKGYNITYPVFIDVESSGGRADSLDAGTRTRVINAFCQTIQNGGYRAGIYANKTWFEQKMNISALSGYKIWLAQYNTQVTYGGKYDMWQYSSSGSVAGISGKVDMNLSYMAY